MNELKQAIIAYIDKFDEGPPIFGMEDDGAIQRIESAIESGEPLEEGAETVIPDDALL